MIGRHAQLVPSNKTSSIVVSNGIGWEKAEQLWYRAATEYFGATTDFKAAAQATLTAATDLGYSESNKATIECAWIAVGVITTPSACRNVSDDGGTIDAGRADGGGGPTIDSGGSLDGAVGDGGFDATARDAGADVNSDNARPVPDATTPDASSSDATTTTDASTSDASIPDTTSVPDAPSSDSAQPPPMVDAGGGPSTGNPTLTTKDAGCSCRVPGEPAPRRGAAGVGSALALLLAGIRRRTRKARSRARLTR